MEEMLQKMKEMICRYADVEPDEITPNSRFVEDLDINSYDLSCMVTEIEENYGLVVEEEKVIKLYNVQNALDYFSNLTK